MSGTASEQALIDRGAVLGLIESLRSVIAGCSNGMERAGAINVFERAVNSLPVTGHWFSPTDSVDSPEGRATETRIASVQTRIEGGETVTEEERRKLFADLDALQKLMAEDEERRLGGSFAARTVALRIAFLRDLAAEIERAKESDKWHCLPEMPAEDEGDLVIAIDDTYGNLVPMWVGYVLDGKFYDMWDQEIANAAGWYRIPALSPLWKDGGALDTAKQGE